jgi:hypothetical protein
MEVAVIDISHAYATYTQNDVASDYACEDQTKEAGCSKSSCAARSAWMKNGARSFLM